MEKVVKFDYIKKNFNFVTTKVTTADGRAGLQSRRHLQYIQMYQEFL